jgi:hypothetical protein
MTYAQSWPSAMNSFATNETIADTTSISNMSVTPPRVLSDELLGSGCLAMACQTLRLSFVRSIPL